MTRLDASDRVSTHFHNGDGGRVWRLVHDTDVELHFIGASVTVQRDGWAESFADLVRRETGRHHAATKNAMGGVGLLFGLTNYTPRASALPRVAFVEFSTGDLNLGLTPIDRLRSWLVLLLERLQRDDSAVFFVHNWRADFDPEDRAGVRRIYDDVAQEYGVPVIQNHVLAHSHIRSDPAAQSRYFRDVCHTTPEGARAYASHVFACVEAMSYGTAASAASRPASLPDGHLVRFFDFPAAAVAGRCMTSTYIYPGTEQSFCVHEFEAGEALSLVASGQLLGAAFISGPRTGWVSMHIDGQLVRSFRCFDRNSHYDRYILLPSPFVLDRAFVELRCAETPIDVSLPPKQHPDFHLPRLMKVIGLVGAGLTLAPH